MSQRFLIMAGGTGGHVFPALAVAKELMARGHHVEWLGTARGLEARVVPGQGIRLHCLNIVGVRGRGIRHLLVAPWLILKSMFKVRSILSQFRPAAVIGLGGYVTGPGGVAAFLSRIPLIIHEQNAILGTTNRLLTRIAKRVLCAFPGVLSGAVNIGNPLRAAFYAQSTPQQRLVSREEGVRLLVLGGSLGAQALNEIVPKALSLLPVHICPQVRHQTGALHAAACELAYQERHINAWVEPFIDDVAQALAWADVVICRAGALTVAEICAVGVGAVLVPYPFAIDDHQTANANWLVQQGGALLAPQESLNPERLSRLLNELLTDRPRLCAMATAARAAATPNATEAFVQHILELTHG